MSDYRNFDYRNADDPSRRDVSYDPDSRAMNAAWGWIAAALFLVVVLAVAFGIGHQPNTMNTASNDAAPPAATHMAPPLTPAPPAKIVAPSMAPAAPISPTPSSPAPAGNGQ